MFPEQNTEQYRLVQIHVHIFQLLLVAPVAATVCPLSLGGGDMISPGFHCDLGVMSPVDFPFCSRWSQNKMQVVCFGKEWSRIKTKQQTNTQNRYWHCGLHLYLLILWRKEFPLSIIYYIKLNVDTITWLSDISSTAAVEVEVKLFKGSKWFASGFVVF